MKKNDKWKVNDDFKKQVILIFDEKNQGYLSDEYLLSDEYDLVHRAGDLLWIFH